MTIYHTNGIDSDLIPKNIKKGVNIFWVEWSYSNSLNDFSWIKWLWHQQTFYINWSHSPWKMYNLVFNWVLFVICVCQWESYNSRCENWNNSFIWVYTMFKSSSTPYTRSFQWNFSTNGGENGSYTIWWASEYFYKIKDQNSFVYTLYHKEWNNVTRYWNWWSYAVERWVKITIDTDNKTTTVVPLLNYVKWSKDQYSSNTFTYENSAIKPTADMIPMQKWDTGTIWENRYIVNISSERGNWYCDGRCTLRFEYA